MVYFIIISLQLFFIVLAILKQLDSNLSLSFYSVVVERYVILITLLAIPGALKLFSWMMVNNKRLGDLHQTISLYIKAYIIRFIILLFAFAINIFMYSISLNKNYLLCAIIVFITCFFIYPSVEYLEIDIENDGDNNEPNDKERI